MKGFLFIGDPHVSSKKPGRRIDDYRASVLQKLKVAGEIARDNDLVPVVLGDLFHRADENDLATLSRLIEVFNAYPSKAIVVGGNHDKKEVVVKEADALNVLAVAGTVLLIDGKCREVARYEMNGKTVALWITPYGAAVPTAIESTADTVILVTHADYAFAGAYPDAKPIVEIKGCDMVVNGHMHKTTPSVVVGGTVWHNPGNIEPLSVDCIDHVPAVWEWLGGESVRELKPHLLPHNRDCFDLTGLVVAAMGQDESVQAILPAEMSHFAKLLSAKSKLEGAKAEDNSSFVEELIDAFSQLEVPDAVQTLLLALERANTVDQLVIEEPVIEEAFMQRGSA
jgi:predicted phosphodiesterase